MSSNLFDKSINFLFCQVIVEGLAWISEHKSPWSWEGLIEQVHPEVSVLIQKLLGRSLVGILKHVLKVWRVLGPIA